jgi:hypothetical protein
MRYEYISLGNIEIMIFISLGRHCDVAYNIKKYIETDRPTHFFDWSRTDFKSVLAILNSRILDTLFYKENIAIDKESYKHDNELTMTLKSLDRDNQCLLFHHDISYNEYTEPVLNDKLTEFIDKYKRRHERLVKLIQSEEPICFLYRISGEFDYADIDTFNTIIRSINSNNKHTLVLLREEDWPQTYTKYDTHITINLAQFTDENITPTWKQHQYDWKRIFETIRSIV